MSLMGMSMIDEKFGACLRGAVAIVISYFSFLNTAKKSARPVEIGYSGSIANGAGFFKSIIAVGAVWITRLPPGLVVHRAIELKNDPILGEIAEPTALG